MRRATPWFPTADFSLMTRRKKSPEYTPRQGEVLTRAHMLTRDRAHASSGTLVADADAVVGVRRQTPHADLGAVGRLAGAPMLARDVLHLAHQEAVDGARAHGPVLLVPPPDQLDRGVPGAHRGQVEVRHGHAASRCRWRWRRRRRGRVHRHCQGLEHRAREACMVFLPHL